MLNFEEMKCHDRVQSAIEYFNKHVFTVENSKDPTWETMCQNVADKLIENLIIEGKSYHYILGKLNVLENVNNIEELLISKEIQLPESDATKRSVLTIFKNKLQNVKKILEEKPQGMKW